MKTICIVAGCFNEKGNIEILYERFKVIFSNLPDYNFNLLLIDNLSTDGTREEIIDLCSKDKRVKAIFNTRNFGHIRSPFYGFLQAEGDAIFTTVSDLQVDPEIITSFISKWERGTDIVVGIKKDDQRFQVLSVIKGFYYFIINKLSEIPQKKNFIGIGLYDKKVADALKKIHDPYPYFRGLIFEVGYKVEEILYEHRSRKKGFSKNNFFTLYDLAMLGICTHSKIPLRLATMFGFGTAFIALLTALFYFCFKLIYWDSLKIGMAPVVIGLFFLGSVQLIFLGIIGEYIGFILTKVQNRPLVFEEKRINF